MLKLILSPFRSNEVVEKKHHSSPKSAASGDRFSLRSTSERNSLGWEDNGNRKRSNKKHHEMWWSLERVDLEIALELFFQTYEPSRIPLIPVILEQFAGDELLLLQELCKKYSLSERGMQDLLDRAAPQSQSLKAKAANAPLQPPISRLKHSSRLHEHSEEDEEDEDEEEEEDEEKRRPQRSRAELAKSTRFNQGAGLVKLSSPAKPVDPARLASAPTARAPSPSPSPRGGPPVPPRSPTPLTSEPHRSPSADRHSKNQRHPSPSHDRLGRHDKHERGASPSHARNGSERSGKREESGRSGRSASPHRKHNRERDHGHYPPHSPRAHAHAHAHAHSAHPAGPKGLASLPDADDVLTQSSDDEHELHLALLRMESDLAQRDGAAALKILGDNRDVLRIAASMAAGGGRAPPPPPPGEQSQRRRATEAQAQMQARQLQEQQGEENDEVLFEVEQAAEASAVPAGETASRRASIASTASAGSARRAPRTPPPPPPPLHRAEPTSDQPAPEAAAAATATAAATAAAKTEAALASQLETVTQQLAQAHRALEEATEARAEALRLLEAATKANTSRMVQDISAILLQGPRSETDIALERYLETYNETKAAEARERERERAAIEAREEEEVENLSVATEPADSIDSTNAAAQAVSGMHISTRERAELQALSLSARYSSPPRASLSAPGSVGSSSGRPPPVPVPRPSVAPVPVHARRLPESFEHQPSHAVATATHMHRITAPAPPSPLGVIETRASPQRSSIRSPGSPGSTHAGSRGRSPSPQRFSYYNDASDYATRLSRPVSPQVKRPVSIGLSVNGWGSHNIPRHSPAEPRRIAASTHDEAPSRSIEEQFVLARQLQDLQAEQVRIAALLLDRNAAAASPKSRHRQRIATSSPSRRQYPNDWQEVYDEKSHRSFLYSRSRGVWQSSPSRR